MGVQRRLLIRTAQGSITSKLGFGLLALVVAIAVALSVGLVLEGGGPDRDVGATPSSPSGATTPSGPAPSIVVPPLQPAEPVLAPLADAPPASLERLQASVADALRAKSFGRHLAFGVAELGDPDVQWSYGRAQATPASTLKLVTTTAALHSLGPGHRFTTSVVRGRSPRAIVLVGGGDPLLTGRAPTDAPYPAPATLEDLASDTAAALLTHHIDRVRLGYDAGLFSGPGINPGWPGTYVADDVVSPISALWVDEGRNTRGYADRSADPALSAAQTFADLLAEDGVQVRGAPTPQAAPASGGRLAAVSSPPLQEIVEHTLEESDNEAAEVLLRQVALAHHLPGSFVDGVRAVRQELTGLGLDLSGATFYDGSGLSRDDVLPVSLLLDVLSLDAGPAHPELRGVITGLPVAGLTGSLAYRFEDEGSAGLGYVRAKTGTLTGVHGLAGIAVTRRGQPLAFVAIADRVPVPHTLQARADLDAIAAQLAACSC